MPAQDIDLQPADITALADRAAVRDLFTRLGYDTSSGRETFADAENMPERLQQTVRHVELLAQDDLGLLLVYLVELNSVTVAHVQALATHFKQLGSDVMAVLTTPDYQRLDFVLFERRTRATSAPQQAVVQVIPRRFTFIRADPSPERLRVIRRFLRRLTWTEPDGIAQWDKLKSAFSIGEWSEEFFDNRGLFADYYLKHRLPGDPAWNDPTLRDAREQMQQDFLAARGRFLEADEATVRTELLEPMLRQLGFTPRPCAPSAEGAPRAPDYELLDPDTGDTLAVCLAYRWDRPLDGPEADETRSLRPAENPGAAVLDLLAQGHDWAIVTNGKHWRLYTAKTESRATNFYQVDAEEAAADVADAFRYFRLMFRAAAFRPCEAVIDGQAATACFIEQLLDGSRKYAKDVGDRLKGRVFEDIFPILAEGFIQDIRHREGDDVRLDDDRLGLVQNATLALLYRLLFLLYAESRDLLPVAEVGGYYEKSLTALKEEIAHAAGTAEGQRDQRLAEAWGDAPQHDALWRRLTDLFAVIGDGDPNLNVPRYNGGLFITDPEEGVEEYERTLADFLSTHALSDRHLARAIDRLARDPDDRTHGLVMIDFKSLGVRQLGSIYEGLLEFRVRIAPCKMAVCTQKGREVVLPYDEAKDKKGVTIKRLGRGKNAPEEIIPRGAVYLENSKHERKASGSYFTPEYIVKYIVEHTVGPVLDDKLDALRDDLNRACADYRRYRESLEAQGKQPHDGRLDSDLERRVIQQCFDLSVLDPAMGSGHFLVTAVDFIADRLIHFLNGFPNNPVERMLRDTRRRIVEHAAREGLILDEARLTPINLLKRHVLKRCIYGVDLNPMAVELAKVSLWLHCFTLGAPLSFLDHHLKCGNSLIGEATTAQARPDGQAALDGTSRWHDFARAVQGYLTISRLEDATIEQVTASRRGFREAEAILRPHREELNTLTAGYFVEPSNERKRAVWTGAAQLRTTTEGRGAWQQAQELAAEHRFFHWPLEFPELWYKPHPGAETQAIVPQEEGEAGFDAVVGNPPWVSFSGRQAEVLDDGIRSALRGQGLPTAGWLSTQGWFLVRPLAGIRKQGLCGLILPAQVYDLDQYEPVRAVVRKCAVLAQPIMQFPEDAFEGVTEPSAVGVFRRSSSAGRSQEPWRMVSGGPGSDADETVSEIVAILLRHAPLTPDAFGDPGVHTGNSSALIISDRPFDSDAAPVREGRDVHPYFLAPPRKWLWTDPVLDADRYYRVGELSAYQRARIVLRQTADRPIAAPHWQPTYFRNSALACYHSGPFELPYVLAVLNSEVVAFLHRNRHRDARQKAFPQMKVSHLRLITVPAATNEAERINAMLTAILGDPTEWQRPDYAPPEQAAFDLVRPEIEALVAQAFGLAAAETEHILTANQCDPEMIKAVLAHF